MSAKADESSDAELSENLRELTSEDIERLMKDSAARSKADAEDRRRLRGEYAPPVGKCRVCGGRVLGTVRFPSDGRIGGPPRQGYVGQWSCETCRIVYAELPTPAAKESP